MFLCVLSADNADVGRQMEEAESRASQLSRSKTLLQSQLEELKKQLDEEVKVSVCVCVLNSESMKSKISSMQIREMCASVVLLPV